MAKRITVRATDELEEYAKKAHLPLATAIIQLAIKGLNASESGSQTDLENMKAAIRLLAESSSDERAICDLLDGSSKALPKKRAPETKKMSGRSPQSATDNDVFRKETLPASSTITPTAKSEALNLEKTAVQAAVNATIEPPEDDTKNISISEDTNEPISEELMASLNEMLGLS